MELDLVSNYSKIETLVFRNFFFPALFECCWRDYREKREEYSSGKEDTESVERTGLVITMAAAANEAAVPQTASVTQMKRFQIVRSGIATVMGLPNEVKLQIFCELRDFGLDTGFGGCNPYCVSNKFLGILLLETNFGSIKVKIAWPKKTRAQLGAGAGARLGPRLRG